MQKMGYRNIKAEELLALPKSREKRFLITFDDGYSDNYQVAYPILKECNCTALIFLCTKGLDCASGEVGAGSDWEMEISIPFLTWAQAREMESAGMEFGSHTLSHARLSKLNPKQLHDEIRNSWERLQARLANPLPCFCAPYGDYPHSAYQVVKEYYRYSFLTYSYRSQYKDFKDVISRVGVYGQNDIYKFLLKIIKDSLRTG